MARIEFLDEMQIIACNKYSSLELQETPHLFLEFHGSQSEVETQSEMAKVIAAEYGGGDFDWALLQEDRNRLWTARHNAYYANKTLRLGCRSVTTDVCVPISKLPEMITAAKDDIATNGLVGPIVGHVGDGNFHSMLLFDPHNAEERNKCKEVANRMALRAIKAGGTCTGEHGIGLGKIELLKKQFGEDAIAVMKGIKSSLDPFNLMNPGKIFV